MDLKGESHMGLREHAQKLVLAGQVQILMDGTAAQNAADGPNAWVTTMTENISKRDRDKAIN